MPFLSIPRGLHSRGSDTLPLPPLQVRLGTVTPDSHTLHKEIRDMQPWSMSWSNVSAAAALLHAVVHPYNPACVRGSPMSCLSAMLPQMCDHLPPAAFHKMARCACGSTLSPTPCQLQRPMQRHELSCGCRACSPPEDTVHLIHSMNCERGHSEGSTLPTSALLQPGAEVTLGLRALRG